MTFVLDVLISEKFSLVIISTVLISALLSGLPPFTFLTLSNSRRCLVFRHTCSLNRLRSVFRYCASIAIRLIADYVKYSVKTLVLCNLWSDYDEIESEKSATLMRWEGACEHGEWAWAEKFSIYLFVLVLATLFHIQIAQHFGVI